MRPLPRSPRFVPLLATALAGLLLVGASGVPSYADSDEVPLPVDPGSATQVAEDSLAAAEDLVSGDSTADPTLVLNQLSQTLSDLPSADQRKAEQILGRPTDGNDPEDALLTYQDSNGLPVAEETPYCLGNVCVHYVATTRHAPPMADANADGIPDWVDQTARVMGSVWNREVAELGYRAPLPDRGTTPAGTGKDEGLDSRLDVYLGDIGKDGYYGYAATDRANPRTSSAYLVLDDDFKDFAGSAHPGAAAPGHRGARVLPHRAVRLRPVRGRLVHGVHGHLDGGAGLRLGQRQPPVPPRERAGDARAQPRLPAHHADRLRQLDLLRVPQPPARRCGGEVDVVAGRRRRRLLHGRRSAAPSRRRAPACAPGSRASPPTTSTPRAPTPRARATAARRSPRRTPCPRRSPAPAAGPPGSTTWPRAATRSPRARA